MDDRYVKIKPDHNESIEYIKYKNKPTTKFDCNNNIETKVDEDGKKSFPSWHHNLLLIPTFLCYPFVNSQSIMQLWLTDM